MNNDHNQTIILTLMGIIFVGAGSTIVLLALNVIPVNPESLEAPRWVVGAAGAMFFFLGLLVFAQGIAGPGGEQVILFQWVQYMLTLGALISFSSVFIWAGLGTGERQFQSSGSVGPISFSGQGDDLLGRCMFGGFGLLVAVLTLFYALNRPLQLLGINDEEQEDE